MGVHLKGANSVAMSSVKALLVDTKRAIENRPSYLVWPLSPAFRAHFYLCHVGVPENLDCKFISG